MNFHFSFSNQLHYFGHIAFQILISAIMLPLSLVTSFYSLIKETCCFKLEHQWRHYLHRHSEGVIRLIKILWLGEYFPVSVSDNCSKIIILHDILIENIVAYAFLPASLFINIWLCSCFRVYENNLHYSCL